MKFKYYITNLIAGRVEGTNDDATAQNLAECEDFFVVHAESGEWLLPGGDTTPAKEFRPYTETAVAAF